MSKWEDHMSFYLYLPMSSVKSTSKGIIQIDLFSPFDLIGFFSLSISHFPTLELPLEHFLSCGIKNKNYFSLTANWWPRSDLKMTTTKIFERFPWLSVSIIFLSSFHNYVFLQVVNGSLISFSRSSVELNFVTLKTL